MNETHHKTLQSVKSRSAPRRSWSRSYTVIPQEGWGETLGLPTFNYSTTTNHELTSLLLSPKRPSWLSRDPGHRPLRSRCPTTGFQPVHRAKCRLPSPVPVATPEPGQAHALQPTPGGRPAPDQQLGQQGVPTGQEGDRGGGAGLGAEGRPSAAGSQAWRCNTMWYASRSRVRKLLKHAQR